jgi:hypothetical protein
MGQSWDYVNVNTELEIIMCSYRYGWSVNNKVEDCETKVAVEKEKHAQ